MVTGARVFSFSRTSKQFKELVVYAGCAVIESTLLSAAVVLGSRIRGDPRLQCRLALFSFCRAAPDAVAEPWPYPYQKGRFTLRRSTMRWSELLKVAFSAAKTCKRVLRERSGRSSQRFAWLWTIRDQSAENFPVHAARGDDA